MATISQELEVSLHMAFTDARQQCHASTTVEHLLLAILDNPSAKEALLACAADIERLRKKLVVFIKGNVLIVPRTDEVESPPTAGFQRVIQRAMVYAGGSKKEEVTGAFVLRAIFGEKNSAAVSYLHDQGITRLDVLNFISHGIRKDGAEKKPDLFTFEWSQSELDSFVNRFALYPRLQARLVAFFEQGQDDARQANWKKQ